MSAPCRQWVCVRQPTRKPSSRAAARCQRSVSREVPLRGSCGGPAREHSTARRDSQGGTNGRCWCSRAPDAAGEQRGSRFGIGRRVRLPGRASEDRHNAFPAAIGQILATGRTGHLCGPFAAPKRTDRAHPIERAGRLARDPHAGPDVSPAVGTDQEAGYGFSAVPAGASAAWRAFGLLHSHRHRCSLVMGSSRCPGGPASRTP
jgi:hypothetical protein